MTKPKSIRTELDGVTMMDYWFEIGFMITVGVTIVGFYHELF